MGAYPAGAAVRLEAPGLPVPVLVRELVAEGVDVLEVRSVERSLEDVFFEMTEVVR